jgi:hypothetical protein
VSLRICPRLLLGYKGVCEFTGNREELSQLSSLQIANSQFWGVYYAVFRLRTNMAPWKLTKQQKGFSLTSCHSVVRAGCKKNYLTYLPWNWVIRPSF